MVKTSLNVARWEMLMLVASLMLAVCVRVFAFAVVVGGVGGVVVVVVVVVVV